MGPVQSFKIQNIGFCIHCVEHVIHIPINGSNVVKVSLANIAKGCPVVGQYIVSPTVGVTSIRICQTLSTKMGLKKPEANLQTLTDLLIYRLSPILSFLTRNTF